MKLLFCYSNIVSCEITGYSESQNILFFEKIVRQAFKFIL